MKCQNHPDVDAAGLCTHNGKPYCGDCLVEVEGRNVAKVNLGAVMRDARVTATSQPVVVRPPKSRIAAALLAFFLGGFGFHHFYLGNSGLGFGYLIFCWTGIPMIVGLIEAVRYLVMSDDAFHAQYG